MNDVVAVSSFATIGAAAIFAVAAASYMAKHRFPKPAFVLDSSFSFWQALVGAGLSIYGNKQATKAANAQVASENAAALANREAAAKAAALATLKDAEARNLQTRTALSRNPTMGGIGCSTFFIVLLGGISALLVMACR